MATSFPESGRDRLMVTVNVCLLDLSKAFDKMDHSALYLKLMDRSIPVQILNVLQNWFSLCMSCSGDQLCLIVTS